MLTVDRFSPVWTKHGTFPPSFLSVYVISCCLFLRDYVCACLSPPFALHIVFLGVLVTVKSVRPGERNSGKGSHIPKFEENKFELFSMHVLSLCLLLLFPSFLATHNMYIRWEESKRVHSPSFSPSPWTVLNCTNEDRESLKSRTTLARTVRLVQSPPLLSFPLRRNVTQTAREMFYVFLDVLLRFSLLELEKERWLHDETRRILDSTVYCLSERREGSKNHTHDFEKSIRTHSCSVYLSIRRLLRLSLFLYHFAMTDKEEREREKKE